MKQVYLSLHNIAILIKKESAFMITMLLMQCVAVCILLFGVAAIQNTLTVRKDLDERSRYFLVNLISYENGEPQFDQTLPLSDVLTSCEQIINDAPVSIENIWIGANDETYSFSLIPFSADEAWVELNSSVFPEYQKGDIFSYRGISYMVRGTSSNMVSSMTMPARYAPSDCLCSSIQVMITDWPTTEQAEKMNDLLYNCFGSLDIFVPEIVDPLTAQFNAMTLLLCGLMMLAIILNLSYAQMYLFRIRKRTFGIYRLCGAKPNDVMMICMMETLLIVFFYCLVGIFMFMLCFEKSVTNAYPISEGMYNLRFLFCFLMAYLLFFAVLLYVPLKKLILDDVIVAVKEART